MSFTELEARRKFNLPSDRRFSENKNSRVQDDPDLAYKMSNSHLSPSTEKKHSIIIYGEAGSGKTKNSLSIATYFGLKRVIDPWIITDNFPEEDTLLVSSEPYSKLSKISKNIFSIEEAIHIVRPRR